MNRPVRLAGRASAVTLAALLFPLAIAMMLAISPPSTVHSTSPPASDPKVEPSQSPTTVTLVIDYGDGIEKHYTRLAHTPGMTVLDALKRADELAAPASRALDFAARGEGRTAFVQSIDGEANEGGGEKARNWIYTVNHVVAKESAGLAVLNAGDTVRWSYEVFRGRHGEKREK